MNSWFDRFRWRYVGTVEGETRLVDSDGEAIPGNHSVGFWILRERGDGKRNAKLTGNPGHSPFAERKRAAVKIWLAGGPLPKLDYTPNPPKPKAKLIAYPGGKTESGESA